MQKHKSTVGRKPKPTLTIGADCGSLVAGEEGGVATVTRNLLWQLSKLDKRNRYILYSYRPLEKQLLAKFVYRAQNRVLPRRGFFSVWIPIFLKIERPDVFLALSQAIPRTKIPTIGFVYDVAFQMYPELYLRSGKILKNTKELVARARQIIAISEASQIDILRHYPEIKDRISVVYPGVSQEFVPSGPKFVDTQPYILYVGVHKKHKNIPRLLAAFARFLAQHPNQYRLVCVGSLEGKDPEIEPIIKKFRLEKNVIFKGYVERSDLPKYYRGASAFISISQYEGFGLPILEALACGTPVVAGNIAVVKQVVGKAGLLVDINDESAISQALSSVVENTKLNRQLRQAGPKQARRFNWRRFARGVLNTVYT